MDLRSLCLIWSIIRFIFIFIFIRILDSIFISIVQYHNTGEVIFALLAYHNEMLAGNLNPPHERVEFRKYKACRQFLALRQVGLFAYIENDVFP